MVPDVDWLIAKPAAELSDVCHSRMVQAPKRIFIERLNALNQADLDAIGKEIILSKQILLLHASK